MWMPYLSVVTALLAGCSSDDGAPPRAEVYLVRHAEKDTEAGSDPPLTAAGEKRAEALAERLADVELKGVYSTNTLRTRSTAAPTARSHQLPLELYDPRVPQAMLETIRKNGGSWLIVGHSNTVPGLVETLGGDPGTPIHEGAEYDRLYTVVLDGYHKPSSQLLRYGEPSMIPRKQTIVTPDPEPSEEPKPPAE